MAKAKRVELETPFEAKHYPPRLSCYTGTKKQLREAKLLPSNFAFPLGDDDEPGFKRWVKGDREYWLNGKWRSHKDMIDRVWDGNYWELRIIDGRFEYSDNLVEIRKAEIGAQGIQGLLDEIDGRPDHQPKQ